MPALGLGVNVSLAPHPAAGLAPGANLVTSGGVLVTFNGAYVTA